MNKLAFLKGYVEGMDKVAAWTSAQNMRYIGKSLQDPVVNLHFRKNNPTSYVQKLLQHVYEETPRGKDVTWTLAQIADKVKQGSSDVKATADEVRRLRRTFVTKPKRSLLNAEQMKKLLVLSDAQKPASMVPVIS
jgi:hypothetical protein